MIASRFARRALPLTGKRPMSVFQNKNHIKETRDKYYSNPAVGADNPTYLKEPGDKVSFGIAIGGLIFGFGSILNGLYSMSYGINKVP